jgi:hypothetical protein
LAPTGHADVVAACPLLRDQRTLPGPRALSELFVFRCC